MASCSANSACLAAGRRSKRGRLQAKRFRRPLWNECRERGLGGKSGNCTAGRFGLLCNFELSDYCTNRLKSGANAIHSRPRPGLVAFVRPFPSRSVRKLYAPRSSRLAKTAFKRRLAAVIAGMDCIGSKCNRFPAISAFHKIAKNRFRPARAIVRLKKLHWENFKRFHAIPHTFLAPVWRPCRCPRGARPRFSPGPPTIAGRHMSVCPVY